MPHFLPSAKLTRATMAKASIAWLLGGALLLPLAASAQEASGQNTSAPETSHYHHHVWGKTVAQRAETVEQRIAALHAKLQITAGEEENWNHVAQVMRDNETGMQGMISAREAEAEHHVTAPEDLRIYEHFTQAHVEGLKALRAAFETLYATMPDSQKLVADGVFDKFGNGHD